MLVKTFRQCLFTDEKQKMKMHVFVKQVLYMTALALLRLIQITIYIDTVAKVTTAHELILNKKIGHFLKWLVKLYFTINSL